MRRMTVVSLVLPFALGGCALIVNGTKDSIFVYSEPAGANVLVDGRVVAKTPAKLYFHRRASVKVTVEKEGYLPEEAVFPPHFDASWILFDLLLTLGIGIPIDLATGAMWNFSPDRATVKLRKG